MNIEKRIYSLSDMEVRAVDGGNTVVEGYASVFNMASLDLGGFTETVDPLAFNRTLQENKDVRALWNHNAGEPLGRTLSKTLTLSVDERGLKVSINLPKTGKGPFVAEMVQRGDIKEMSFGFITRKDTWNANYTQRTLQDVDLFEVSPVTFPAYPDTSLAVRSMEQAKTSTISESQKAITPDDDFDSISRRIRLAKL